jgi:hypothetical protein
MISINGAQLLGGTVTMQERTKHAGYVLFVLTQKENANTADDEMIIFAKRGACCVTVAEKSYRKKGDQDETSMVNHFVGFRLGTFGSLDCLECQ